MNILNLLIKKKHSVGIEIGDSSIRVSYFRQKNKKRKENELILIEEPITVSLLPNGTLDNKELLSKSLKKIWEKEKLGKNSYAIVSIPEDKIYSHLFSFPKTFSESQIKDAIDLAIDFQLPFKRNDVYLDWEYTDNSSASTKEVLISSISKNIANNYIESIENAGIDILAVESHLSSFIRSAKFQSTEKTLFIKNNKESTTIFIVKDNTLQFSRTIPINFIKDNVIELEKNKIKSALEAGIKERISESSFAETEIKDKYKTYLESNNNATLNSKWLISIGTLIRGEIEQGQDNQISLLPIGTAEAYSYQKIKLFISLIRNIIIGVSIFFLTTFIASYILILYISHNTNNNIIISPATSDMSKKELLIKKVNALTQISGTFLSDTTNWSILIDEINSRTIDGIIISNLRIPSINDTISITGISKDRNTLNAFKKTLQESTYLTNVDLPITNLEQKGDIPFSITFRIINPSMLFYK